MKRSGWSLFYCIANGLLLGAHLVHAETLDGECDATAEEGACHQSQQPRDVHPQRHSKLCRFLQNEGQSSSITSAQTYKPNAPVKSSVCDVDPTTTPSHNIAHWPWWRSQYGDAVPLVVRGNIYSCGDISATSNNATIMEVWQPRPDGTHSSLRPGIEEGDCRARVPVAIAIAEGKLSNHLGSVYYETLAPGSPGILNGLIPNGARDCPPYGPGSIGMHLKIEGHRPFLGQLDTSELEQWLPRKDSRGRFRFRGRDVRPHAATGASNTEHSGGMEIQSVKKIPMQGYELALEVELDVFLEPSEGDSKEEGSLEGAFCSKGRFGRLSSSFFQEPIAICRPSLLDFFAL